MAGFADQLGSLLVGLARARQIADLESAAIAEQYRQNPLLEGLSVPRVRVPELVIELPLLIELEEGEEPNRLRDADGLSDELLPVLDDSLKQSGVDLPSEDRRRFRDALRQKVRNATGQPSRPGRYMPKEVVLRAVEEGVASAIESSGPDLKSRLGPGAAKKLSEAARRRANEVAEMAPGKPPSFKVSMVTGEVKEKATATSVARLRIVLREEGLEWTALSRDDGKTIRSLTVE
jgi:hypothetical protein